MRFHSLLATAGVLVFVGTLHAQLSDTVYEVGKAAPAKGTVEVTKNEIKVDVGGSVRSFQLNEVKKVTFAEDPGDLGRGRDHVIAGKYDDARAALAKVDPSKLTRKLVASDYYFYKSYADGKLALAGGSGEAKKAAIAALLDFVAKKGGLDSHHYFDACSLLGDLAIATQDFEKAATYYGAIVKGATLNEIKMKAQVNEATALLYQKNYPEAQKRFVEIMKLPAGNAEVERQKQFAKVGAVTCLAETGRHDAGIKAINDLIEASDPQQESVLFGRAYNALGRCYLKSNQTKDAILAYLHTELMFDSEPEAHAEALYFLSKLWADDKHPERAVAAKSKLRELYAGSYWAQQN